MRVLVVEDNEMMRDVVARSLRLFGYVVATASQGKEALAQFDRFAPDLVITDLIMPEMDGLETTMAIRGLSPKTKIIVMSGCSAVNRVDYLEVVRRLGADDVLQKPFNLTCLQEKVNGHLGAAPHRAAA